MADDLLTSLSSLFKLKTYEGLQSPCNCKQFCFVNCKICLCHFERLHRQGVFECINCKFKWFGLQLVKDLYLLLCFIEPCPLRQMFQYSFKIFSEYLNKRFYNLCIYFFRLGANALLANCNTKELSPFLKKLTCVELYLQMSLFKCVRQHSDHGNGLLWLSLSYILLTSWNIAESSKLEFSI